MSGSRRPATGELLTDACASGDQRRALEAMRDSLAASMEAADPNVVAQIAGRLQAVLKELAGLPEAKKVSKIDELAARRKDRLANADTATSTGG